MTTTKGYLPRSYAESLTRIPPPLADASHLDRHVRGADGVARGRAAGPRPWQRTAAARIRKYLVSYRTS